MGRRILLACLPLLLAANADALAPGERSISLFGGGSYPKGDVSDPSKIGVAGGAGFRRQFTRRFSGVFEGEYLHFGDIKRRDGVDSGADVFVMGLAVRFDPPMGDSWHAPFLAVGPALNRVARNAVAPGIDADVDDWVPGVAVSVGTMFRLAETWTLGPVVRYRSLSWLGYALEGGIELAFRLPGPASRAR